MSTTEEDKTGRPTPTPTADPAFPDTATWVAKWLCPHLEREIKRTFEWCPQWWDHPEAVQRLEALWRAWEVLRVRGGSGMSTWWVDHADHHLARLCNPDIGPFGHCHTTHGRDIAPLRTIDPPDGWRADQTDAVNTAPTPNPAASPVPGPATSPPTLSEGAVGG